MAARRAAGVRLGGRALKGEEPITAPARQAIGRIRDKLRGLACTVAPELAAIGALLDELEADADAPAGAGMQVGHEYALAVERAMTNMCADCREAIERELVREA